MRTTILSSLICLSFCFAAQATTITLNPASGDIQGIAGSDIGWGFTMTSDPVFTVSVVTSDLLGETNPGLGIYTDFIGAQGGPGSSALLAAGAPDWTQSFDFLNGLGVGDFSIDPNAPVGSVDKGTLEVQYETFCPACSIGFRSVDIPFSVTVVGAPEPSTMWLVGICLGVAALRRFRTW
jgi:PEP-CTERM motif